MKNQLTLPIVIAVLLCACAKPEPLAPGEFSDETKPQHAFPTPETPPVEPSGSAADSCDSAECKEACVDAGDLIAACTAAFAAGCFSDAPPGDFDCDWKGASQKKPVSREVKAKQKADQEDDKAADPPRMELESGDPQMMPERFD